MDERKPLTADEDILWRALTRIMTTLPRALEEHFVHDNGVTVTDYGVLVALSEAPGGRLGVSHLAAEIALSVSRISRVVDDLNRRGLVRKCKSPQDGRASQAVLTPEGLDVLKATYPGHVERVRALVFDHLTSGEVENLGPVLSRIARILRGQAIEGFPLATAATKKKRLR